MDQLGVFAKYWEPGHVKTRLAAMIGSEASSRLYLALVRCLLHRLAGLADRRVLAFTPAERRGEFAAVAGDAWQLEPQVEGDLGERMRHYFEQAHRSGARRVVLLGSDSPNVPLAYVAQAFELLEQKPVVIGPSADGGYWLLGTSRPDPPIFDRIAWSTEAVFQQTTRRLDTAAWPYAVLQPWYDVDELADLVRLRKDLHDAGLTGDDATWRPLRRAVEEALAARWP